MLEQILIYALQTAATTTPPVAVAPTIPGLPIDVNTLLATLLPLGGLAYAVMKSMASKMKTAKEDSLKKTADVIETYVLPALQQNKKFVAKTEVQDVKIEQIAEALYKYMGKDADKIQGLDAIKQKKLIEDAAIAKIEREEYDAKVKQVEDLKISLGLVKPPAVIQQVVQPTPQPQPQPSQPAPSIVWDEATKTWVSK